MKRNKIYLSVVLLVGVSNSIYSLHSFEQQLVRRSAWDGFHYNNDAIARYNEAIKVIKKYLSFAGNERILDIDSGTGRLTFAVAKFVPSGSVHGISDSSQLVNFAQIHYNKQENVLFDFRENMLDGLVDQSYDIIMAFGYLDRISEKISAFNKISALCAQNGTLCLSVLHNDNDYIKARNEMLVDEKWRDYFQNYTLPIFSTQEDEIKQDVITAGFEVVALEQSNVRYVFSGRNSFRDWFLAMSVQCDQIPLELREEFADNLLDKYLTITGQKDYCTMILSLKTLFVVAKKS